MGLSVGTALGASGPGTDHEIAIMASESRIACSRLMRYLVLASDYDGTLAQDGRVDAATVQAIERLRRSGRKFILVTGREIPDLEATFAHMELCDRIVAENGAVLYNPATRETRRLANRPPDSFVQDLRRRGIEDLSVGHVVIATSRLHESEILGAIRDAELELQIIVNKDALMILPAGINKMTGLRVALEELKLSRHNVVGVGDAENDHAFLEGCGCSVAVANALPTLKEKADLVTRNPQGAGVTELVDHLLANDLSDVTIANRTGISIGKHRDRAVSL